MKHSKEKVNQTDKHFYGGNYMTTFGSNQNQSSQCMTNIIQVYRDSLETEEKDNQTSTSPRLYRLMNSSNPRNDKILINNQTE